MRQQVVYITPTSLAGGGIAEKAAEIFQVYDTERAVSKEGVLWVLPPAISHLMPCVLMGGPAWTSTQQPTSPSPIQMFLPGVAHAPSDHFFCLQGCLGHDAMMTALAELGVLNGLTTKKLSGCAGCAFCALMHMPALLTSRMGACACQLYRSACRPLLLLPHPAQPLTHVMLPLQSRPIITLFSTQPPHPIITAEILAIGSEATLPGKSGRTYSLQQFVSFYERLAHYQQKAIRQERIKALSRMPGVPEGEGGALQSGWRGLCLRRRPS